MVYVSAPFPTSSFRQPHIMVTFWRTTGVEIQIGVPGTEVNWYSVLGYVALNLEINDSFHKIGTRFYWLFGIIIPVISYYPGCVNCIWLSKYFKTLNVICKLDQLPVSIVLPTDAFIFLKLLNQLRLSDADVRKWTGPSSILVLACHLFFDKAQYRNIRWSIVYWNLRVLVPWNINQDRF